MQVPSVLVDEIAKGRASLFLGAGASCEAGFPSARELSNHLVAKASLPNSEFLLNQTLDLVVEGVSVASEQKVGLRLCKKSYNANKNPHLQRKMSEHFPQCHGWKMTCVSIHM